MDENKLLDIRDLKTYFFIPEGVVRAVDGVSLQIPRGKTLGVLGESGSGKSVTALSVMRLIPNPPGKILAGSISLHGMDMLTLSSSQIRKLRGKEVSMIFQEPMTSLNPVYTVGNQIAESFVIHQTLPWKEAWDRAVEMLQMVGIPSPEKRIYEYPHQLSGGMRQRVMIAMALACRPQLLIADEPTTALDVTIQAQILDLMLELQEELDMAIMLITHDLGVIAETSDQVAVMYAGEVLEFAPLEDLFKGTRHPYTMGLLLSIPRLGEKVHRGKQPLREIPGIIPNLIHMPPGCPFAPRCSLVEKRCTVRSPPLFTLNEDHFCKCWLVEKDALNQ